MGLLIIKRSLEMNTRCNYYGSFALLQLLATAIKSIYSSYLCLILELMLEYWENTKVSGTSDFHFGTHNLNNTKCNFIFWLACGCCKSQKLCYVRAVTWTPLHRHMHGCRSSCKVAIKLSDQRQYWSGLTVFHKNIQQFHENVFANSQCSCTYRQMNRHSNTHRCFSKVQTHKK